MKSDAQQWQLVNDFIKKPVMVERKYSHHQLQVLLMNISLVGMTLVDNGLIMGFQCMLKLIKIHILDVRYNMLIMENR